MKYRPAPLHEGRGDLRLVLINAPPHDTKDRKNGRADAKRHEERHGERNGDGDEETECGGDEMIGSRIAACFCCLSYPVLCSFRVLVLNRIYRLPE